VSGKGSFAALDPEQGHEAGAAGFMARLGVSGPSQQPVPERL